MRSFVARARAYKAAYLEREMARHGVYRTQFLRPQDTMIVGFPKSGHTWMQSLVVSLKYGLDPRIADDQLIQDLLPDLHQRRWHKRYSDAMCFKSHMLPRSDFRRVIYLLRDGRDVMVSYYHFRQAWGYDGSFLDRISDEHPEYKTWAQHVDTWLDNPFKADIIYIRYEDLLDEPTRVLRDICSFLGLDTSAAEIETAAVRCSFKNMRSKEDRLGRPNPSWPPDKRFMRRGVSGSYKDEMPQEVLREFMQASREVMQRAEYF